MGTKVDVLLTWVYRIACKLQVNQQHRITQCSNVIWRHISGLRLVCCLTEPGHFLNQGPVAFMHVKAISQEIPAPSISKIELKTIYREFHSNLPVNISIDTFTEPTLGPHLFFNDISKYSIQFNSIIYHKNTSIHQHIIEFTVKWSEGFRNPKGLYVPNQIQLIYRTNTRNTTIETQHKWLLLL